MRNAILERNAPWWLRGSYVTVPRGRLRWVRLLGRIVKPLTDAELEVVDVEVDVDVDWIGLDADVNVTRLHWMAVYLSRYDG